MNAQDIIRLALRAIGVLGQGQTPRAEQLNDALAIMNMMFGQWNKKRWLVPHLIDVRLQATGSYSYSIGPGGDFDIPRPDRISDAYVRLNSTGGPAEFSIDFSLDFPTINNTGSGVDYPLKVIQAREDYDRIGIKTMGAFPYYVFLDSAYPVGRVYFWPVPNTQYELHLVLKDTLQSFPTLDTTINLPPEYLEAIYYNLAGRLAPTYGVEVKPVIVALAEAALNTLRQANTQMPSSRLPSVLTRNRRGASLPTFVGKPGI